MACFSEYDCRILLRKVDPRLVFKGYTLKLFSEELRGCLSEHLLLTVETCECEKMSFFMKQMACFKDSKYFEREVLLYEFAENVKKVMPQVSIDSIPKFVYSNRQEVLVLENLHEQGYTDGGFNFTREQLKKAIESLAKFHAITLAYEEYNRLKLGRIFELPEEYGEFPDPIFNRNKESSTYKSVKAGELGVHTLIDLYFKEDKVKAEDFKDKYSKYLTKLYKLFNEKNTYRKVISHGDLRGINMVFKYDENNVPIDCKLLNFQHIRYAPPANDLTMLIYYTSSVKQYQNVHHFYDHYYKALKLELNKLNFDINTILPLSEFIESCRLYTPCAKIIFPLQNQISISLQNVNFYKSMLMDVTEKYLYREFLKTLIYNAYDVVNKENFPVEDCFKIINNTIDQDYTFLDYDVKALSEKGGFLGEHALLKIRIKTKQELTLMYFLKQPPALPSQKDFAIETGVLFKEIQFYARLIPEFLSVNVIGLTEITSKCYNADDYSVVLDDLRRLGFLCAEKRKSMDLRQVRLVLKTLAKLHASGLIYEERTGLKLNKVYAKELQEAFYGNHQNVVKSLKSAKKGIRTQIEIFPDDTEPKDFYSKVSKIVDAYAILTKPSGKYRNTICHGDLWANNIFLSDNRSVLVDFQSYRYCPPAHDIMQFIYLSTNRKFREKYMNEIIDYYHQQLQEILIENGCNSDVILSYAAFLESCRIEKTMAVVQAVTHLQNIMMSNERMEYLFGDAEYCKKTFFVDRSDNIKETCLIDPIYRQGNHETITDARELIKELDAENFDFDHIIRM